MRELIIDSLWNKTASCNVYAGSVLESVFLVNYFFLPDPF